MNDEVRKIMAILNDELMTERKCYQITLKDMKKIRNPIKKMKCKKALDMFQSHVAALAFAIIRIERELGLKDRA